MDSKCKAPNRTGKPCSATHFRDGYCRWHHPDLEAQRQAERTAGGQARSNKARARKQLAEQVMAIEDIDALLCTALVKVSEGKLEPGVGSAMAGISRTIVGIRTAGDFEKRLQELEQTVDVGNVRRYGA
jgi:hypothetical protein